MIVTLAVRILQIIFALIVLALSVVLIKGMGPVFEGAPLRKAPSLIDYGSFCGGAGIFVALIGVIAVFVEPLQGLIMMALDGLATFFVLAGGIAYAATIKVGSCTDLDYLAQNNKVFPPSADKTEGHTTQDLNWVQAILDDTEGRCKEVQATTAFLWFLFAAFLASTALSFMNRSRGGGRATMV